MAAVNQNSERYSSTGGGWQISAQADFKADFPESTKTIPPLQIPKGGAGPATQPLLESNGIILNVGGVNIISSQTQTDVAQAERDNNPHYTPVVRTTVNGQKIGGTVPVLNIDTSKLQPLGERRDVLNRRAGVKSVDYLYEGPQTAGLPNSMLDQINFTVNPDRDRPADTFEVYNLRLSDATYGIEALVINTKQPDNYLDKAKFNTFMGDIADRLSRLRTDFNALKRTFYNGDVPPNNGTTKFTQVASTDDPDNTNDVVFKDTTFMGVQ